MNPNGNPEDYDGPLCMLQLDVGLQIPVRGDYDELDRLIRKGDRDCQHVSLVGLNGKPVGLSKSNIVIYAPAEVQRQSAIEVPKPTLMVPGQGLGPLS